jgi:hypothetical protein
MKNLAELTLAIRPARRGGFLAILTMTSLDLVHTHNIRILPGADLPLLCRHALERAVLMLEQGKLGA